MALKGRPATDWLLAQYAAGNLPPAGDVLVASFLDLNPAARDVVSRLETVGGWSLETSAPVALGSGRSAHALLSQSGESPGSAETAPPPPVSRPDALPPALAALDPAPFPSDPWVWRAPGVYEHRLEALETDGLIARLLRIEPGRAIPRHTHVGLEATLVLEGAFEDATGSYARGDLALADDSLVHQPVAAPGCPCICLAVSEAPLRLTGAMGRFLNLVRLCR